MRQDLRRSRFFSGYEVAEFAPEAGDTIRRAYNGLLMAVRRQYPGQIGVYWRGGKIYLKRLTAGKKRA